MDLVGGWKQIDIHWDICFKKLLAEFYSAVPPHVQKHFLQPSLTVTCNDLFTRFSGSSSLKTLLQSCNSSKFKPKDC